MSLSLSNSSKNVCFSLFLVYPNTQSIFTLSNALKIWLSILGLFFFNSFIKSLISLLLLVNSLFESCSVNLHAQFKNSSSFYFCHEIIDDSLTKYIGLIKSIPLKLSECNLGSIVFISDA